MAQKILIGLLALLLTFQFPLSALAQEDMTRVVPFTEPDIRNDYCGVHIDFKYCKCAFHDEYCEAIGMEQDGANSKVRAGFSAWVAEKRQAAKDACDSNGGKWMAGKDACHYCDEPHQWSGSRCLAPEVEEPEEEAMEEGETREADRCPDTDELEEDWEKYSDIDDAIPVNERSYEAQQFVRVGEEMTEKMVEAFEIEHDMEVDRQTRLALRDYRDSVIAGLKTNLLKAFWRLAYVTYSTIRGASGNGQTYVDVVTASKATLPVVANGIGLIQSHVPKGSALEIDTKTDVGKIKAIVAGAELEALKTLGDPTKVATKVIQDVAKLPVPSADISDEEVEILRTQRELRDALDNALQESYKVNALRRRRLMTLEKETEELRTEARSWEEKEKARVIQAIQADCEPEETSWIDLFIPRTQAASSVAIGDYIINYDLITPADTTGDGVQDRNTYTYRGRIVLTAYDLDANGEEDMWLRYDPQEYVTMEAFDTDGDGQADEVTYLDRDEEVQEEAVPDPPKPNSREALRAERTPYVIATGALLILLIAFLLLRNKPGKSSENSEE